MQVRVLHPKGADPYDTRLTMVHAGRNNGRAARTDYPGLRRDRLDCGHTAGLGRHFQRVVCPIRHRCLGSRLQRRGHARAELERYSLVVGSRTGSSWASGPAARATHGPSASRVRGKRTTRCTSTGTARRGRSSPGPTKDSSTTSSTSARRTPGRSLTSPSCTGTGPRGRSSPALPLSWWSAPTAPTTSGDLTGVAW
jgi:hypothetical protein